METNKKSQKTMNHFFAAMNRAPPKKLGGREIPNGQKNCLEGLTFVITGILEYIERDDAVELIKKHGGKVTTSISGKTSYVVLGRDAGPAKMEKIKKLKIKTINDEELFKMIEAHPNISNDLLIEKNIKNEEILKIEEKNIKNEAILKIEKNIKNEEILKIEKNIKNEEILKLNNDLWVEKYRPNLLKNLIGHYGPNSPANKLLKWLKNWNISINGKIKNREDGTAFKAALLSGKPGIGKTTCAILCCNELNLDYIELNASDTRNKTLLKNTIEESSNNQSFKKFIKKENNQHKNNKFHVIIMDEVDGISGNQDRGGLIELVSIIKKTNVPIICICNDRMNRKIQTLSNYCFDLRFQKPRIDQIKGYCSTIICRENIKIESQELTELIIGADQDIRQIINRLQMLSVLNKNYKIEEINKITYKDTSQTIFESIRKLLNYNDSSKLSINEKMDLFFVDYSLTPLFMQENYNICIPLKSNGDNNKVMKIYSEICDSIAMSTITENIIRTSQSWNLLPIQGFYSCILPSFIGNGNINSMINFPQWLGKNSTTGKNERYLDQLHLHTYISTFTNRQNILIDYIPFIYKFIYLSLMDSDCIEDGSLDKVIEFMKEYNLTREDWDLISELQSFDGMLKSKDLKIQTKILSTFTRKLNKVKRSLPFSITTDKLKKSKKSNIGTETLLKSDQDYQSLEESQDENNQIITFTSRKRSTLIKTPLNKDKDKNKNKNIKH